MEPVGEQIRTLISPYASIDAAFLKDVDKIIRDELKLYQYDPFNINDFIQRQTNPTRRQVQPNNMLNTTLSDSDIRNDLNQINASSSKQGFRNRRDTTMSTGQKNKGTSLDK